MVIVHTEGPTQEPVAQGRAGAVIALQCPQLPRHECFRPRGPEPHSSRPHRRGWWGECGESTCVCVTPNTTWMPCPEPVSLSKAAPGSPHLRDRPRGAGLPAAREAPQGPCRAASFPSGRGGGQGQEQRLAVRFSAAQPGAPLLTRGAQWAWLLPPGLLGSSARKDGVGAPQGSGTRPCVCPSVPRARLPLPRPCVP